MVHSGFFELLSTLSCTSSDASNPNAFNEFRAFKKMMDSPFFAAKASSIRLMDFLQTTYYPLTRSHQRTKEPTVEDQKAYQAELRKVMDKRAVWASIFPGAAYQEAQMAVLLSKTKAHLERFISYQAIFGPLKSKRSLLHNGNSNLSGDDRHALDIEIVVLRHLLGKGEAKLFQKRLQKAWQLMDKRKNRDGAWHEYAFRLEELHNDFQNRHHGHADHYNEMSGHFDQYFLLKKLRLYCAMLNRAHILGKDYEYPMLKAIAEFAGGYSAVPMIAIYSQILVILKGDFSHKVFMDLWDMIQENKAVISKQQLKQFAMYCRNSLQFQKIKGAEDIGFLNQRAFEITQFMDEEGIVGVNGKISDAQFVFVVKSALAVEALAWTQDFISREAGHVIGKNADGAVSFAECYLSFLNGNHLAALRELEKVQFSARYLMMQARCLRLKLLYSLLDRDDPIHSDSKTILKACEAFAKLIKTEKTFSAGRKAKFRNFVGIVKHLVRFKKQHFPSQQDLDALAKRIFRDPVEDKEWVWRAFQAFV